LKTYTVDSKAIYFLFVVVLPVSIVAFGLLWIWVGVRDPSQNVGMVWFGVVWLVLVVWGGYRQATMPETIQLLESGTIRLVGFFRTSTVEAADVISIRGWGGPFVELKHRNGKILLLQFTGFHQFLTELSRLNSNVKIRGI
jgi:hypothetical protein